MALKELVLRDEINFEKIVAVMSKNMNVKNYCVSFNTVIILTLGLVKLPKL